MKLFYCKQSSVANPVRVGGGYQVWAHPPFFKNILLYTCTQKTVRTTIPSTPDREKNGLCKQN